MRRPARPARGRTAGLRLVVSCLVLLAAGCSASEDVAPGSPRSTPGSPVQSGRAGTAQPEEAPRSLPALRVRRVVGGLAHPWDVAVLPSGELLVTERETRRLLVVDAQGARALRFPGEEVWASGETGLMSLAVDPGFADDRRVHLCHGGYPEAGGTDVRVVTYRLDAALTSATPERVLLEGLPTSTGRHGGCRLLVTDDGSLLVGTGDAARSGVPRDLGSLGGKVLRLDPRTGEPWPGNPWAEDPDPARRHVLTYGHRNVQGLAQRRDGTLWSIEHGPDRDDEVNLLRPGADHGWDPGPGYDEDVPMTDTALPGAQRRARWRSGSPTIATSGAVWVRGPQWGAYDGTLAVAALKGERLVFMAFDARGRLRWTHAPDSLRQHGRLRSVTRAPDGDLLVTTAEGADDAVLRVSPAG